MVEKVLKYFNLISQYPRSSGNEEKVANFLVDFAKEHNFEYYKDNYNNVLIKKIGKKEPIILQSHTDMVCVGEPDYKIDFLTDSIKTVIDGDYLSAYKTSLGADNGIGVAIILSLLDDDNDYSIEALFTTDEEVTMTGALNFDYSKLASKKLISLDGMSDEELINGCASICDMKINFNPNFTKQNKQGYKLIVKGLKGGHSGADINKNIGNANNILVEILSNLTNVELESFEGGNQFNFIANFATATFVSKDFEEKFDKIKQQMINKYPSLVLERESSQVSKTLSEQDTAKLLCLLNKIKTGVIVGNNNNIVLSQNLSSVSLSKGLIKISQRGHNEEVENENIENLKSLSQKNGFDFKIFDKQNGFEATKNSTLTKDICNSYQKLFNDNLKVINKHISVEACIFKQKMEYADIVIIAPKILGAHSTKETVYIPSIKKVYNLLQSIL